jgi:hypothetical protein
VLYLDDFQIKARSSVEEGRRRKKEPFEEVVAFFGV